MAGILEEGPIRKMLREKGIVKHQEPVAKGELMGRLMAFMGEYGDSLSRSIPMQCDILATELTRVFQLTGDEKVSLREECIKGARRALPWAGA